MASLDKILNEIIAKIETPRASLLLIRILKEEGKTDVAIQACLKVLEIFPDDMNIRKFLAETYFEQGSVAFAEKELDKLSYQIDELSSVFKLKAKLFKKMNRPDKAIEALTLYLAHRKSDTEAAQFLSELNASRAEEQAILATPTLAEIYVKQGEIEEAKKIYQQLVRNSPDDENSRIRLSELESISRGEGRREIQRRMVTEKKIKLIGILENCLATIEKRKPASLWSQG